MNLFIMYNKKKKEIQKRYKKFFKNYIEVQELFIHKMKTISNNKRKEPAVWSSLQKMTSQCNARIQAPLYNLARNLAHLNKHIYLL